MNPRLSKAPASYLPSKKSQRASEARIAKINELYESMKKKHHDSVVSNNSTSVASDGQEGDNCVQINGLDYRLPYVNHGDEPSVIVKEEDTMNVFRLNQTPTPPGPQLVRASADKPFDEDDDDDDYQAELRFTPKFKSRGSLLTMKRSKNSDDEARFIPVDASHNVGRRPSRVFSLRKALGDPLPLPYMNKRKISNNSSLGYSSSLPKGTISKNKQLLEKKWKNLIAQDKILIEKRFAELRQRPSPGNYSSISNETIPPVSVSTPDRQNDDGWSKLSRDISENKEKLDYIITLLSQQQKVTTKTIKIHRPSREVQLWTICIIVLIISNLYVYHYF